MGPSVKHVLGVLEWFYMLTEKILFQNRGLAFYYPPRPPGLAKDHTFSGFFFRHTPLRWSHWKKPIYDCSLFSVLRGWGWYFLSTMEGSGPSWRRLSQFVQISEFFQFYITDICQTSESFPISIKLKQEYTVKELFLRSKAGEMKPFRRDWSFQVRGGIKKTVFFSTIWDPPPFFLPPQFFLIRIFLTLPRPPPLSAKNGQKLPVFYIKPPFVFANYAKKSDKTLLDWVRPPPLWSKNLSIFW